MNEVVIGLKDKDTFNSSQPKDDGQFANYVTNPTLPALIQLLFGSAGVVAPTNFPRTDLVTVFLTGVPGLNHTAAVAEMLRLNTSTPTLSAAMQNNLGVIGGDVAGFPNGRRPGDDVVDVALRVVMGVLLSTNDAPSGPVAFHGWCAGDGKHVSTSVSLYQSTARRIAERSECKHHRAEKRHVSGPYVNTAATYNSSTKQLATSPTGGSTGFYRVKADLPGVSLAVPSVTSSNVLIGVKLP